mgnify:CR=1 FL=1
MALKLFKANKVSEAKHFCEQALDITSEMVTNVISAARERNVDCIVAPFEADAELAFLTKATYFVKCAGGLVGKSVSHIRRLPQGSPFLKCGLL